MKEMLVYSIPLIPHSLSWTIINLSDRVIITSALGPASNGIYAVSNKFPTIINTVYNYFAIAWKESAAKALHEDDSNKYYNRIYPICRKIFGSRISESFLCVFSVSGCSLDGTGIFDRTEWAN